MCTCIARGVVEQGRLPRKTKHEHGCRHTLDSSAPSTTQFKCTSMRQLPAAAVTRVDASSMNAASVYSCSAYEIHVRLARSTSSQDMSIVVSTITTHLHVATTQCASADQRGSFLRPTAAAATCVDASSMNAVSVYSCSATQIHVRLARSTASQDRASAQLMRPATHLRVVMHRKEMVELGDALEAC